MIRITNFGGLYPKASARALPDDGAQTATDLQPGIREFRPLGADTTVVADTGLTNPKTIYRLARTAGGAFNTDMTTGWIVKAAEMSFVKAQINNDTTERTFATFDDASAAPRVYDASDLVTGRQLGVPAPTTAPTMSLTVVDEFTAEDRDASIVAIRNTVATAAAAAVQSVWRGGTSVDPTADHPGTSHDGYLDIAGAGLDNLQFRAFRLGSTGGADDGAISDTYDSANGPAAYQWVLDPSLGGAYRSVDGGWPTWGGSSGQDHWTIPFSAYGLTYTINTSGLDTALLAIDKPNAAVGVKLLTSGQATAIVAAVSALSTNQTAAIAPKLNNLKAQVDIMHSMLGGGGYAQRAASLAAFYAQSDVASEFTNAIANCAEALWNLAVQANAAVHVDYPGGL